MKINKRPNRRENVLITGVADLTKVRQETWLRKPYSIMPVVMMVEGVYTPFVEEFADESDASRIYFSADELRSSVGSWNGRAVSINHPEYPGTANTPENYEKSWVGFVFNARFDEPSKSLKAEIWVDNTRGLFIKELAEQGKQVEVSIGVFSDLVTSRNDDSDFTLTNITSDHLAVLPDTIGACSFKDGCGIRAVRFAKHVNSIKQSHPSINAVKKEVVIRGESLITPDLLNVISPKILKGKKMDDCKKTVSAEDAAKELAGVIASAPPKKFNMDEWLNQAPDKYRDYMVNSMRSYDATKKKNIDTIVSCSAKKFCKESLGRVSDMDLLDTTAALVTAHETLLVDYAALKEVVDNPENHYDYQLKAQSSTGEVASKLDYVPFYDAPTTT